MKSFILKVLEALGIGQKITRQQLRGFLEDNSSGKLTLDLGCGSDKHEEFFPNRVGFDLEKNEGVDTIGDAHRLPFNEERFECVVCLEVLEHLLHPQRAVDEMYRVLKPGGTLILTTRFLFPLHNVPEDFFRFTRYGLENLLSEFEEVEIIEEVPTFGTFSVLVQRLAYQGETLFTRIFYVWWLLVARFLWTFRNIITREWGDINTNQETENIMTSGYYVIASKTKKL